MLFNNYSDFSKVEKLSDSYYLGVGFELIVGIELISFELVEFCTSGGASLFFALIIVHYSAIVIISTRIMK